MLRERPAPVTTIRRDPTSGMLGPEPPQEDVMDSWGDDERYGRGHGLPPSGDPGHSDDPLRVGRPRDYGTPDAARIGLDKNTPEGAEIAFFSHLNGSKPSHKVVAWIALFLMFGVPVLLRLMDWLRV
jgi:hypothetical protein